MTSLADNFSRGRKGKARVQDFLVAIHLVKQGETLENFSLYGRLQNSNTSAVLVTS